MFTNFSRGWGSATLLTPTISSALFFQDAAEKVLHHCEPLCQGQFESAFPG